MAISYSDSNTSYSSTTTTYIGQIGVVSVSDNLAFTENDTYNSIAKYIDTLNTNDSVQAIKTIFVQVEDGINLQDEVGQLGVVSVSDNLAFTENDTYNSIAKYIDTLNTNESVQAIKNTFVQVEDGINLQDEDKYTIISNLKEQLGLTDTINAKYIIVLVDQLALQENLTLLVILKLKELLGLSDDVSIFSGGEELVDWMDRNDLDTDWTDRDE